MRIVTYQWRNAIAMCLDDMELSTPATVIWNMIKEERKCIHNVSKDFVPTKVKTQILNVLSTVILGNIPLYGQILSQLLSLQSLRKVYTCNSNSRNLRCLIVYIKAQYAF